MARRLILDTGLLVAVERGSRLEAIVDLEDDLAIAAVTVAELRVGVVLGSARLAERRQRSIDELLESVVVENYDATVARVHGDLAAFARREGSTRGVADLIIAATAVATDRIVVTTDRAARFDRLPGVRCVTVSGSRDWIDRTRRRDAAPRETDVVAALDELRGPWPGDEPGL